MPWSTDLVVWEASERGEVVEYVRDDAAVGVAVGVVPDVLALVVMVKQQQPHQRNQQEHCPPHLSNNESEVTLRELAPFI